MLEQWFVKLGKWIAREQTFDRMIAPAIADMQAEASHGRLHRLRHVTAVCAVLFHAALLELRTDGSAAFGAEARQFAWKRATIWYAGIVSFMTLLGSIQVWSPNFRALDSLTYSLLGYNLPRGLQMEEVWPQAFVALGTEALVTGLWVATIPAILYLYRRRFSWKSIATATLTVAALTLAFAWAIRPVRLTADRALFENLKAPDARGDRPVASFLDLDERVAWWRDIQTALNVIPSAFMGIVLARRRGWRVPATLLGMFLTWIVLDVSLSFLLHPTSRSVLAQGWRDFGFDFTVGMLWLVFDALTRARSKIASGGALEA